MNYKNIISKAKKSLIYTVVSGGIFLSGMGVQRFSEGFIKGYNEASECSYENGNTNNENISDLVRNGIRKAITNYSEKKATEVLDKLKMPYSDKEIEIIVNEANKKLLEAREQFSKEVLGCKSDSAAYKIANEIKKSDFLGNSESEDDIDTGKIINKNESKILDGSYIDRISKRYSSEITDVFGKIETHVCMDYNPKNDTVKTMSDGVVVNAVENNTFGNYIMVASSDSKKIFITYGHLGLVFVKKGQILKAGEPIGLVGSGGKYSTGKFATLKINDNGKTADPTDYMYNFHHHKNKL